MRKFKQNHLSTLEFDQIMPGSGEYGAFPGNAKWALPQLMAFLASNVPLKKDDTTGKYSVTLTLRALKNAVDTEKVTYDNGMILTTRDIAGILTVLKASPRGEILGDLIQSKGDGLRWAANVPLFFSAFKQYKNINYAEWDWQDEKLGLVLDKKFLEYSKYFNVPRDEEYTDELLLTIREAALMIKSGSKAGTLRNPISTTSVYGNQNFSNTFSQLPDLLKLQLTQLWVFHPKMYHQYMITNTEELDKPALPLISSEVENKDSSGSVADLWGINYSTPATKKKVHSDIPWDI